MIDTIIYMFKVGIVTTPLIGGHQVRGIGFYTKYLLEYLKNHKEVKVKEIDNAGELGDIDLLHYPFFDLFFRTLKVPDNIPTVITIHDVTPLVFRKHYPSGIKGKINFFLQKKELKKVKTIITDSSSSKKDVTKYLKISEDKIFSIYLAPAKQFKKIIKNLENTKIKFNLPKRFVVYVGDVNWNKNLLSIAKSCIDLNLDIYFIGKSFALNKNLNHPELKDFAKFLKEYLPSPRAHLLGYLEDTDLVNIYNLASFLLYPSYYEGFGLPVLEAQACGLPVITSKISSLPEVAGEGALFVDPFYLDDIKEKIKQLLSDDVLKEKLIKKGFENIKRFSWDKTAQETIQVYEKAFSRK